MIACHSIHDHICCHGISYDLVFMSHSQSQPWYPAYTQVRLVDLVGFLAALAAHLDISIMVRSPHHLPRIIIIISSSISTSPPLHTKQMTHSCRLCATFPVWPIAISPSPTPYPPPTNTMSDPITISDTCHATYVGCAYSRKRVH